MKFIKRIEDSCQWTIKCYFFIVLMINTCQGQNEFVGPIEKKFISIKGQRLTGAVNATFTVTSPLECAWLCMENRACISYNLIRDGKRITCELNSNGLTDAFVPDAKATYHCKYSLHNIHASI